jgi:hypothetical protein
MKRARGATLAEIVAATGRQKHTVGGFVRLFGNKGEEKIESMLRMSPRSQPRVPWLAGRSHLQKINLRPY